MKHGKVFIIFLFAVLLNIIAALNEHSSKSESEKTESKVEKKSEKKATIKSVKSEKKATLKSKSEKKRVAKAEKTHKTEKKAEKKAEKVHAKKSKASKKSNSTAPTAKQGVSSNDKLGNEAFKNMFDSVSGGSGNMTEVIGPNGNVTGFNFSKYFGNNNGRPLVVNSIGRQVYVKTPKSIMLTKFPFAVTRCDQIVKIKAKFISDMNEYRNRDDAYFTITAYYVNMYHDENANELVRSILMTESPQLPYHIKGARPCILIPSPLHGDKDITMCFETVEQEKNILEVLQAFKDNCRAGFGKINKLALTKALINCGGKGEFVDPKTLLRRLREKYYSSKDPWKVTKKWFHPGSDRVPGTDPPKKPKVNEALMKMLNLKK